MAIDWGNWNGHLRVGIEILFSPSNPSTNTTSVDMTLKVYVGTDGFNYNDNQTIHISGYTSTSQGFTNDLSSGYKLVYQRTFDNQAISYSGGPSRGWTASVSGAFDGSNPTNSWSQPLPERPADTPDKTGLPSIDALGVTSVRLDWNPPASNGSPIQRYQVQVDNNTNWIDPIYNNGNVESSTVLVSGLTRNTVYYARVRAFNAVGWGFWSDARSFRTNAELPDKPVTEASTSPSPTSDQIRVRGETADNGGTSVTDWDFQLSRFSDFREFTPKNGDVGSGGGDVNGATYTGLTRATNYYFRSSAQNSVGTSPWSNTVIIATLATAPDRPGTPAITNIAATSVSVGYGTLPSNGGSAFTKWEIQRWVTGDFANAVTVDDLTDPATPQSVTGLVRATNYTLRVRAVNAIGPSDWSPEVTFTTAATKPDAGPSPVVSVVSQAEVRVQIAVPVSGGSPITGYDIQWSTDNFVTQAGLISNTLNRDMVIGGLAPSTVYKFRYRAINAIGIGDWSAASSSEETLSGGQAKVAGTWRNVRSRAKVAGTWRDIKTHKKVAGVWRL